ncbi:MAG TPA: chloride channel protein [Kofleriaceae bacterium]|nr:chloride channel protein [Kofleriaceae bacterium]
MSTHKHTPGGPWDELGDFTAKPRVIIIALIAACIGVVSGYVALALLKLIAGFTNLFFFQSWSAGDASPIHNKLGWLVIIVPVIGGIIVGLMARFGSEKIRGHGIPEALESIMLNGSRVDPKVAVLKPISAAISIGSGGPFGAEGPIIMTGGAFGSLIAQAFRLTAAERKTLLAAGAAGGMAATFGTPIAATLLAVELLLFEFKPRSLVPVGIAAASAMACRHFLFSPEPLFTVAGHSANYDVSTLAAAAACGIGAGVLATLMTHSVYAFEDMFHRLPLHWMWWPAIGGLVIGIGGYIEPRALGVGYDQITALLQGHMAIKAILMLAIVKWAIWSFSLGSGTSGGVLAPLLMIGGALGALEGQIFPDVGGPGFWALISMGACLGGTMRAPLTGILFAAEVTQDFSSLLPVAIATMIAFGFTVLVVKRSILTEKVVRRGYHISCEYSVDPLDILFVRDVITLVGEPRPLPAHTKPIAPELRAHLDDTLKVIALRMAVADVTILPIVDEHNNFLGEVALADVLKARLRHLEEETRRERIIPVGKFIPIPKALIPEFIRERL